MYLAYYFRKLDWTQLNKFMRFVRDQKSVSSVHQWTLLVFNSLRYNISLLEFYQFGFLDKNPDEKAKWAGTGTMYEYQLLANPPEVRELLNDKRCFYQAYREFFRHEMYTREELIADEGLCVSLLNGHDRLVLKKADGNCGVQVSFVSSAGLDPAGLNRLMVEGDFDLVETFVQQHEALDRLSPSGVNTVRIFTRLDDSNECVILGCRLRISVDSPVDNLAAGNLAASIDEETGIINGAGIYSDITKPPETIHPVTGVSIVGFKVPFWQETLAMVREASVLHLENRSIGWDIVITPEGPGLIEGNHDWCKLVWQLPVGQGLKHLLND